MRIPAGAKPGLAPGQGALGLRLVRWSRGADAGACRCWPASAGGGVANRRRMPRIAVTGLRLGTALKQVFILEFDTMRVCAYQIMRMQTHVTKKHASECCVQLGVLSYANLMHMMHSYVHLYAQVYIYRHSTRYRYCTIVTTSSSSYCINHHHSLSSASSLPSASASAIT